VFHAIPRQNTHTHTRTHTPTHTHTHSHTDAAAHVGIGISGMEGLQAARSADFAIGQFRFLRKLLLVHGGWAYSRMSKLVLFMFYKNITLYIIQLWYATQNGFSGQTIFETWTQSAYNILLTALQPIAIGVLDQYISARMLERYPDMYKLGQRSVFYNDKTFAYWICNCFYHSLVLFWCFSWMYGDGSMFANGKDGNNWVLGELIYTGDLITITWKAALIADTWFRMTLVAFLGSIAFWFAFFPAYSTVGPLMGFSMELQGLPGMLYGSVAFWFAILLIPVLAILRDYAWKA
jgi:phospholipid-transporting ATPase